MACPSTNKQQRHASFAGALLVLILLGSSACSEQFPRVVPATPVGQVPAPAYSGTIVPTPALPADSSLLALPAAFRYELTLRSMQAEAPTTVIVGQYRDGEWVQTSQTGGQAADELLVARDPATNRPSTYTQAAGDATWTRWPGVAFDVGYGLASPFTVLRLRPLATLTATPEAELDSTPAATGPDSEVKTQALFSTEIVQRVLTAGILALASDEETRAALEAQVSPFFVPQTVTYWTNSSGQVLRAAGTLLSLGPDNASQPWMELTAAYSAYDDPTIAISAPAAATNIADVAGTDAIVEQAAEVQPGVNLRVRVFATAGVPSTDAVVTAYPAGKKTAVDEKLGPDAQFKLKPGKYDVRVRSGGAEQWLKEVVVTQDAVASNDVLFDFALLTVTVKLNAETVPVDVVIYPSGDKTNFAAVVSENPASFRLPEGRYDVEVATQDGRASKRVDGVQVRGGLETTLDLELAR